MIVFIQVDLENVPRISNVPFLHPNGVSPTVHIHRPSKRVKIVFKTRSISSTSEIEIWIASLDPSFRHGNSRNKVPKRNKRFRHAFSTKRHSMGSGSQKTRYLCRNRCRYLALPQSGWRHETSLATPRHLCRNHCRNHYNAIASRSCRHDRLGNVHAHQNVKIYRSVFCNVQRNPVSDPIQRF